MLVRMWRNLVTCTLLVGMFNKLNIWLSYNQLLPKFAQKLLQLNSCLNLHKTNGCPSVGEDNKYERSILWGQLLIHITTWMNLQRIMLSGKKPISKGYILHNSIYNVLKMPTLKKCRRDEWLPEVKDGVGPTQEEAWNPRRFRESRRNSRKTTWFQRLHRMRPLPATASPGKSHRAHTAYIILFITDHLCNLKAFPHTTWKHTHSDRWPHF